MADPRPAGSVSSDAADATLPIDDSDFDDTAPADAKKAASDESTPVDPGQTAIDGVTSSDSDAKPKRGRGRKQAATKSRGMELVLTVNGTIDGADWRADIVHAGKVLVADLAVPTSAVSAAAKDLHPEIAEAIESVLSVAREQQRSRVEALQAQLEAAQRALADLQD
jgi:hypothetical protein